MDYISPNDLRALLAKSQKRKLDYNSMPTTFEEGLTDRLINELANALAYNQFILSVNPTSREQLKELEDAINQSRYTPALAKQLIELARDVVRGEV